MLRPWLLALWMLVLFVRVRSFPSFIKPLLVCLKEVSCHPNHLKRSSSSTHVSFPSLAIYSGGIMATATSDTIAESFDMDPLKNLPKPLILGSASYTRKLILKQMGVDFHVLARPIDERQVGFRDTDTPEQLVHAVAHAKMRHLIKEISSGNCEKDLPIGNGNGEWILLTADQVVTCKGRILEKPKDVSEAKEFVTQYGKHPCSTVGCVTVTHLPSQTTVSGIHSATIHFLPTLTAERASDMIDELIKANEPILSCAGGLMIEHPLTRRYVDRIDGNEDSVMGLCPETVRRLLSALHEALPHPSTVQ